MTPFSPVTSALRAHPVRRAVIKAPVPTLLNGAGADLPPGAGPTGRRILASAGPAAAVHQNLSACEAALAVLHGSRDREGPVDMPSVVARAFVAAGLTAAETRVAALLLARCSDREIAAALSVALPTVRSHCRAAYRKLGVADRCGLRRQLVRLLRAASPAPGASGLPKNRP